MTGAAPGRRPLTVVPPDAPSRPSRTVLARLVHVVRTEPVACQGVIQSGLAVMVGFGLLAWTAEQTGLVLGLGLAVLAGGVLLLLVAVWAARGFARFERIRLRGMLGKPAATPAYVTAMPT